MKRPEQAIHQAVVSHLKRRAVPGLVWFHCPNGGKRVAREAAIMKGLGIRAGVSDLILLHRGQGYALELKADKGRATPAQTQFISEWNAAGGIGCIAEGLDRAVEFLEAYGLLTGGMQ